MEGEDNRDELVATLILSRLPEIGSGRYWQLKNHFGSGRAILSAPISSLDDILEPSTREELRNYQRNPSRHPLHRQAEQDLQWLADHDVALLTPGHKDYPSLLRSIHRAPPLLYVNGDPGNLGLPQLAIVGSRNPSPSGKSNSFDFARQLAATGFAITSGLALGVDGAAHRGALAAGGKTIAVLGTGIDRIYPHRHRALYRELLDCGGTVVSEFPIGTQPQPAFFPQRNRIISGLSLGVLVVEAAVKSGSLITARFAMEQGREVFAIPGSIHNPLSRGCHALLREGATLVEQVDDLREPLQGLLSFKWSEVPESAQPVLEPVEKEERLVLLSVGYEDTSLDTVLERSGLEAGRAMSLLMTLELKGLLQQTAGGYQRNPAPADSEA